MKRFIEDIIAQEKDMTIATLREDGFPQATTVSYASDGMVIYFGTWSKSQKARNIGRFDKVSLTINRPYESWTQIQGLSMGAKARILADPAALEHVQELMLAKFPPLRDLPAQALAETVIVRIDPVVISVLDYRKGFGHTELVTL